MKLEKGWNGISVVDSFKNWSVHNHSLDFLPTFVCWFIWADRNKVHFEGLCPFVHRVVYLSRCALKHSWKLLKESKPRILVPYFPDDKPLAWFDGAAQHNGNISGSRGIIKIDALREYIWTLNCGRGSNMRVELMGAWFTLVLAARHSVYDIHIMGDSKIVID
jgi:hypothetical protein